MPLYEYVCDETGETIEELMPMTAKHPEKIKRDGKVYRRVFGGTIDVGVAQKTHGYPYVSRTLPRGMKNADHMPDGKPIITSARHEREIAAQQGLKRV